MSDAQAEWAAHICPDAGAALAALPPACRIVYLADGQAPALGRAVRALAADLVVEDALLARLAGRRGIAVAHHCGIAVVWEAWARAPSSGAADMSSVRVDRYRLCLDAGGAGQGAGTAP
ncbi:hypothetical protein [Bordetella pertussis]|uniref:hypothetical protein n=1 Tax=Bordetella pertussis TaxID=520 RepID=UPI0005DEC376|nr:hypothetical protein [Bordetella pertussis]CPP43404.1 Uncharacterised protein [Bordetella pertussis]